MKRAGISQSELTRLAKIVRNEGVNVEIVHGETIVKITPCTLPSEPQPLNLQRAAKPGRARSGYTKDAFESLLEMAQKADQERKTRRKTRQSS